LVDAVVVLFLGFAGLKINGLAEQSTVFSFERRRSFLFFLLLLGSLSISRPVRADNSYNVTSWNMENGLPSNQINAILQTRDGYLWFATPAGLARFDGLNFVVFDRNSTPALPIDDCNSLAETVEGLWIGTALGLVRFTEGKFIPIFPDQIHTSVGGLLVTSRGELWGTCAYKGVFALRENKIKWVSARSCRVLAEDAERKIWGVGFEVARYSAQTGDLCDNNCHGESFSSALTRENGESWLGASSGYVLRLDKAGVCRFELEPRCRATMAMLVRTQGDLLLATESGLWLLSHNKIAAFLGDRVPSDTFFSLAMDREGNIWCGSRLNGVYRLRRDSVATWSTEHNDDIWTIRPATDGGVWVGTRDGISKFLGNRRVGEIEAGGCTAKARGIVESENRLLWAGIDGLWEQKAGVLTQARISGTGPVSGIEQDREGNIWLTLASGLERYAPGKSTLFGRSEGFGNAAAWGFLQDREGNIWTGTHDAGLFRLREGRFTQYTTNELPGLVALPLREEQNGAIWIGTDKGLVRYKNGTFRAITTVNGLPANPIGAMEEDEDGNFWCASSQGIFRVAKQELDECADRRRHRVDCLTLGVTDGMLTRECNAVTGHNSLKTPEGKLLFATMKGVAVVEPKEFTGKLGSAKVLVQSVKANNQNILSDAIHNPLMESPQSLQVGPGGGRILEFRYTAMHFAAPEKLRFRYRLHGLEEDWVDAGTRRAAFYPNLVPGSYRFEVISGDEHNVWNETPATVAITLQPFLWQRWQFYILCGALALGLAAMVQRYRLRVQRHILEIQHSNALLEERSRIARDMHDDLGARLTHLSLLGELSFAANAGERPALTRSAEELRAASREITESMDEIVWAINPQHDSLRSFLAYFRKYTNNYFAVAGIKVTFISPEQIQDLALKSDQRHHLFLAAKEAINNVIQHSAASEVVVKVSLPDATLTIDISDNGRGFDPALNGPDSNGLLNMSKRMDLLGGKLHVSSCAGAGTSVRFELPFTAPCIGPSGPTASGIRKMLRLWKR
jgi:signal transduction histidine kinase/ligand-binding sensor domain-containing protein